jgi:hypothetical protein
LFGSFDIVSPVPLSGSLDLPQGLYAFFNKYSKIKLILIIIDLVLIPITWQAGIRILDLQFLSSSEWQRFFCHKKHKIIIKRLIPIIHILPFCIRKNSGLFAHDYNYS